jgi:hypothetical protein
MPLFKYFGTVGSALLAIMFASDAYFSDDVRDSRFDGSFYESALYAPRLEEALAGQEVRFTRDVTAAARVKEVFAQFDLASQFACEHQFPRNRAVPVPTTPILRLALLAQSADRAVADIIRPRNVG